VLLNLFTLPPFLALIDELRAAFHVDRLILVQGILLGQHLLL
jgi:hypothetical protein